MNLTKDILFSKIHRMHYNLHEQKEQSEYNTSIYILIFVINYYDAQYLK
jgi:hypothetical protein